MRVSLAGAPRWARTFVARHWSPLILALAVLVGVARITATYSTFWQTWDEPAHLAAGLEWLQRGSFRLEPMHPPLPRVAIAIGPYLAGLRSDISDVVAPSVGLFEGQRQLFASGIAVLESGGRYERNLRLARYGVLPFFALACVFVWLWARRLFGDAAAADAVSLFSTLPSILAHSGIATTDMALVAILPAALYAWTLWLERATYARSLGTGLATAGTLLAKMSGVVFLPACLAVMLVLRRWRPSAMVAPPPPTIRRGATALLAATVLLTVWSGYRFHVGSALEVDPRLPARIAGTLGDGAVGRAFTAAAGWRIIPAHRFLEGVKDLLYYNKEARKSYLLGRIYPHGTPAFFPVAVLFKTPLPFLVFIGLGIAGVLRKGNGTAEARRWQALTPLAVVGVIFVLVLPSRINIGSRHVLPAFVPLAVLAGLGVVNLWRGGVGGRLPRRAAAAITCALLGWQVYAGIRVHPDYLAYFNELSIPVPESARPILLDSDLDWGQDLKRLADTLRVMGLDSVHIVYHGSANLNRRPLPPHTPLEPWTPTRGWIAISIYKLKMGQGAAAESDHYAWLERHQPVGRVGRSILLYHIP